MKYDFTRPALFDCHVNGADGGDFNDPNLDESTILQILACQFKNGVAKVGATLVSNDVECIKNSVTRILAAREKSALIAGAIPLIFLEVFPSYHPEARGAHNPAHIVAPTLVWPQYRQIIRTILKRGVKVWLLIAPEWPHSADIIQEAADMGCFIGIGHTNATPDEIHAAVEASQGKAVSVHLWNGANEQQQRFGSPIITQLAQKNLPACLILDRHHVPQDNANVTLGAKGPDQIFLVSDGTHLSGQPPGTYEFNGLDVELEPNGRITLLNDRRKMAGSSALLPKCLSVACSYGFDFTDALHMASDNPAAFFGLKNEWENSQLVFSWDENSFEFTVFSLAVNGQEIYPGL